MTRFGLTSAAGLPRVVRLALLLLGLAAAALAAAAPARADYRVCNETSYVIRTAVAYKAAGDYISRGWVNVFPGFCETLIDKPLTESTYYIHGRSIAGHQGPMHHWAGNVGFCIKPGNFEITGDDDCEKRGLEEALFDAIDVGRSKNWQTTFTEPKSYTLEEAAILGTQRLLVDLGYISDDRIDGYAGPGTTRAIRKFSRNFGISVPDEPSLALYRAMLTAVEEKASTSGFEICNKSKYGIWAAIGVPLDKSVNTKGWYELQPDQCVKPIVQKLARDFVYVYAETNDAAPKKAYWRGDVQLCANDIVFSLTTLPGECTEEGLQSLRFRKIDTEGREKWTHFITDDTSTVDGLR